MFNNSYKLPLVFAISIHVAIIFFLLIKFTSVKPVGLRSKYNFINATAINVRDIDDQVNKAKTLYSATAQPKKNSQIEAVKKQQSKKNRLQTLLQKNMLAERSKEIATLKKEQQKYKKTVAKKIQQQQLQKMLQDQIAAEKKQLAQEGEVAHGHLLQGEIDKYKALILQAISSNWIVPEGVVPGDFCQLLVNVAPGGIVLNVQILGSSGNVVLNRSAEAAILKASPLPVPEEIKLFDHVRTIKTTFKPEGIVGN